MAENVREIAAKLGARVVGPVPDAGGGAFGAARLGSVVAGMRTDALVIPLRGVTREQLHRLAEKATAAGQPTDPVELAVRLLERAIAAAAAGQPV